MTLFFSEAQSEPIVELEQGHNYPKNSGDESGIEGFIAENTFNMTEAAPTQSEFQTLEPALGTSLVEEITVKEIHAEIEIGIKTHHGMGSVAPNEGKFSI